MKKIYLLLATVLLSVGPCLSQINQLSQSEFDDISFNGVTVRQIINTDGNVDNMSALFGKNVQQEMNDTAPFLAKHLFIGDDISFDFEDVTDTGNSYQLTYIIVDNPSILVKVKGITAKLGDDLSVFGNNVINTFKGDNSVVFSGVLSCSLSFKISETTDKVIEIELIIF